MCRLTIRLLFLAAFVPGFVSLLAPPARGANQGTGAQPKQAKEILADTGVQGGLVVHLGCGEGKLTAALRAGDGYLVQGLDAEAANVEKARRHIRSLGLCGKVSIDRWDGRRLPYVDNVVNLIVAERPMRVSSREILRVLAPGPPQIDDWTHFLHDADNNAVAQDGVVGPPRHIQWKAEPLWTRNHHTLASISAVVSAGGRVFTIFDEASPASMDLPGRWSVVARDAFSGVRLWKRSIPTWAWHRHRFRSGPVQLPRTLVAGGDQVYLPLGLSAPLTALDAASGEVVRTYPQTEGTEEVVLYQGVLLVVTGSPAAEQAAIGPQRSPAARFPNRKSILAIRAETGETLWKWSAGQTGAALSGTVAPGDGGERLGKWSQLETANLVPLTLAAADRRVLFAVGKGVVCLDLDSGKELWGPAAARVSESSDAPAGQRAGKQRRPGQK
ncbi:MAG: methyltransferase domain-containing protein, partial [Planctomycetota bacterium]